MCTTGQAWLPLILKYELPWHFEEQLLNAANTWGKLLTLRNPLAPVTGLWERPGGEGGGRLAIATAIITELKRQCRRTWKSREAFCPSPQPHALAEDPGSGRIWMFWRRKRPVSGLVEVRELPSLLVLFLRPCAQQILKCDPPQIRY